MSHFAAPDPEVSARAAATLEWLAKVAGSALIVWGFLAKVGKPFLEWRSRHRDAERMRLVEIVRKAIHDELTTIGVFVDLDALLEIAHDNRERLDEFADLLTELGLSSDRRSHERTERAKQLFDALTERQRNRRRAGSAGGSGSSGASGPTYHAAPGEGDPPSME